MVHLIHPGCSISTSPAVHLGATFQPQAQVALSSASCKFPAVPYMMYHPRHYESPTLMPITL